MRLHALQHRPFLLVAAGCGFSAGLVARLAGLPLADATLIAWAVAAASWLLLVLPTLLRASPAELEHRTSALDEGTWPMLGGTVIAAIGALASVLWALAAAPSPSPPWVIGLALGSVLLSWAFVHVLFALHYAHQHWRGGEEITFPGNANPDFLEFLYFAFSIGMAMQVGDATTNGAALRRMVLLHAVLSFLFNAIILASAVNLSAALIQA